MKSLYFLLLLFLSTEIIASTGTAKSNTTMEDLGEDLERKAKVSSVSEKPVAPPPPPVELQLCRKTGANVSARYFLKGEATKIMFQGRSLHKPEFFDTPPADWHLTRVENLLGAHKTAFGNSGLGRNHLIPNIYVFVKDTTNDTKKIIEATLYARKIADTGAAEGASSEIEWIVKPSNAGVDATFKFANFVSSAYDDPDAGPVGTYGSLPLSRADVRPLGDDDNHGDRLALDTFMSNIPISNHFVGFKI